MKKILSFLLILCLVLSSFAIFSSCGDEIENLSKNLTTYDMELLYNDSTKTVSGSSDVEYVNSADVPLQTVCFLLYPNAFRKDAVFKPVSALYHSKAYPNGLSYGGIEISAVTLEGKAAEFTIGGEDLNVLEVTLPEQLFPGDRVIIGMTFSVKLPNVRHRMGYAEDTVNLGNLYPIAAIYQNGGFVTYPYYASGDPFFSEVANYNVKITVPKAFKGAFTGEITASVEDGDNLIYQASAKVVRDFAMVFSKYFEVIEQTFGEVKVLYYYYRDPYSAENLACAVNSLKTYNELFGEYRYPTLSVVKCDFVYGGMEYPALVYISDTLSEAATTEVIAHEIAHQWWYALVGSNQIEHAWLDEALADYSTALFFDKNPDYNVTLTHFVQSAAESYRLFTNVYKQILGTVNTNMNRKLNEYLTEIEYVAVTYSRGTVMFDEIKKSMGEEKFLKALHNYYQRNCFKIATPAELSGCLNAASRAKISALLESFVNGEAVI